MKVVDQNGLQARLTRHFREVLSIGMDLKRWPGEASLPAFLRETYAFLAARVLGAPCLFLVDRAVHPTTPAAIRKHIFEVQKRWDGEVVYVAAGIDSARRKQLIDQKVPFVVPGNQVYLPMLGIDLREHFKKRPGSRGIVEPCGAGCIPPRPAAPGQRRSLSPGNGRVLGLLQHEHVPGV